MLVVDFDVVWRGMGAAPITHSANSVVGRQRGFRLVILTQCVICVLSFLPRETRVDGVNFGSVVEVCQHRFKVLCGHAYATGGVGG